MSTALPPVPHQAPIQDRNGFLTRVWSEWFNKILVFAEQSIGGLIVDADVDPSAAIAATKVADGSVSNAEFQRIGTLSSNAQDQLTANATAITAEATARASADTTHAALTSAHGSTALNTAGAIMARDGSGQVAAATFTGALTGNVTGNCSGTSGSTTGNAATVTTNANLTGPITSVGNATSVASQTGTGTKFVMDASPTLVTPNLGTPSTLIGTNITGTASGLTAGSVTTNANLTGPITSTGNATAVAAQTGTGSTFVMQASPTLTTPNLGTPSTLVGTNITGTASGLTAGTVTTNANLTGDVTSSGNATTIANDAVTNAKAANMATATFKGRTTAGTGDPEDLTATQATALLNNVVGDSGSGGTKGLVPAPAAGDAAAAKFLKADGSWGVPAGAGTVTSVGLTMPSGFSISGSPVTGAGTLAVTGEAYFALTAVKTTTYSIATTDSLVQVSGASGAWTATLPTAVGVTGKVYRIKRTDDTPANAVTIATTSSQTIDGATTRALYTQYEALEIVSDGSNWHILQHQCSTPWVTTGTFTFNGIGTTSSQNSRWRRVGDSMEVRIQCVSGTLAASTFSLTTPFTMDSAKMSSVANSTAVGHGTGMNTSAANIYSGNYALLVFYDGSDTAKVYFTQAHGSTSAQLNKINGNTFPANNSGFTFFFAVPISGWFA